MIERVGIVGLGKMGLPMARHMLSRRFRVAAYDIDPSRGALAAAMGVQLCGSAAEVAAQSELVIVIVGFDSEVMQILTSPDGLLAGAADSCAVAIASTVYPETMHEIAAAVAARGRGNEILDIPLCRGERAAEDGTLLVLGGGAAALFEQCRLVFSAFASDICRLGELGAGQAGKMINNFLLWASVSANDEALKLGAAMGLEPETLRQALLKSSGRNWALETWHLPRTMPWAEKDMAIVADAAARLQIDLPLSRAVASAIVDLKAERGFAPPMPRSGAAQP